MMNPRTLHTIPLWGKMCIFSLTALIAMVSTLPANEAPFITPDQEENPEPKQNRMLIFRFGLESTYVFENSETSYNSTDIAFLTKRQEVEQTFFPTITEPQISPSEEVQPPYVEKEHLVQVYYYEEPSVGNSHSLNYTPPHQETNINPYQEYHVTNANHWSIDPPLYEVQDRCYYSNATPCCLEKQNRFFVKGDFLYWKPGISGLELDFGTTSIVQTTDINDDLVNTTQEYDVSPKGRWQPGYRIGAGYEFDDCRWEIDGFWTHFQGNDTNCNKEGSELVNKGTWRVKFDQVDVLLAYTAHPNESTSLKPFAGIRGAKIHQGVHSYLVTNITLTSGAEETDTRELNDHQNFQGFGPLVGVKGEWFVGKGFSFYGTVAGSVLYGDYKVYFDDSEFLSGPTPSTTLSRNTRHLNAFDYNVDLVLGLQWQTCICNAVFVTIGLDFEHHEYFDQGHLGANYGDLSFDGAALSLNVGF